MCAFGAAGCTQAETEGGCFTHHARADPLNPQLPEHLHNPHTLFELAVRPTHSHAVGNTNQTVKNARKHPNQHTQHTNTHTLFELAVCCHPALMLQPQQAIVVQLLALHLVGVVIICCVMLCDVVCVKSGWGRAGCIEHQLLAASLPVRRLLAPLQYVLPLPPSLPPPSLPHRLGLRVNTLSQRLNPNPPLIIPTCFFFALLFFQLTPGGGCMSSSPLPTLLLPCTPPAALLASVPVGLLVQLHVQSWGEGANADKEALVCVE